MILELILSFISIIAITLSMIFFYKYNKYKKLHKNKYFLPQVSASFLSNLFEVNEYGPTFKAEVSYIGRGDLIVPGGTSDAEAWILAVLAKQSKTMFEFGTCTGKTTYLWAKNSPADAKIYTLTLPPEEAAKFANIKSDDAIAENNALKESAFTKFLYTGTEVAHKVVQIFADSKLYDESTLHNSCDLIFIDGSHAYSYIKSDSEKAFKMLKKGGLILWHDYDGVYRNNKDVYKYLNELSSTTPLFHVKGTTFVVYKKD